MAKTLLYRVFGIGKIPKKLRPVLGDEGIEVADEGISGWLISRSVDGPGKRFRRRAEGFSGCLVVTKKRIICYSYGRRQINIALDDPRISELIVYPPKPDTLSLAFESSAFHEGWKGLMEFRFRTDLSRKFYTALVTAGAQKGRRG